ncbi:DUF881 domain-containing protein [Nocardioides sp. NPDC000445]|uniref:DUF881 domain-containing protein n=1 Tax=Nocardioides sp. NPDC000445 TaxID=3154257 RepID=UPI003325CA80
MKRTAAKRTPAKKAPAKKPATPPEETVAEPVTDDGATPEASDEGTPPAEQAPAESVETTDAAEVEEPSEREAPAEAESAESSSDDSTSDETVDKPAEPVAEEPVAEEPVAEEPVAEEPVAEEADDVEPVEPVDFVELDEPAEPVESAAAEESAAEDAEKSDEPAEVTEPDEVEDTAVDEPAEQTDGPDEAVVPPNTEKADEPDEADESEEPEKEPAPLVGRARLFDALTHFRRGQVAVAALLCVLGYAAVVQVQTNTEDSTYAGLREQELIDILSGLAGTTQKAQEQIEELEATRDELEDQTLQQQTALQRAEEQVDTLRVIAGTVPVSGPGITIEIDPGADPLRLTALLDLIEELRTSGAEAMEIEGADGEAVRLVASSSIEVSQPGAGLNVGGELISPPYRLQVIGPPDTLAGAIDFYQGPQDQLEEQGAEVKVESEEKIDIESIHTVSR